MSKSLNNYFTVRDLLDQGVPGEVIRFVLLGTHYRKPMDWTKEKAVLAVRLLRKWRGVTGGVTPSEASPEILANLADDLNTAGAIAELHRLASEGDFATLLGSARLLGLLETDMGGWIDHGGIQLDAIMERFSEARARAVETRDFADVDRMKAILKEAGVTIMMNKGGVVLAAGPEVDLAAVLESLQ